MDYTVFKKEFVERFAAKGSQHRGKGKLALAEADELVDNMVEVIKEIAAAGDSLTLGGLGTFTVKERAASRTRNIGTGELNDMPAHKVLKFKPSAKMRQVVMDGVVR